MASFKEDVKSNLKENFRNSMEDNTGIVGQVLKERREKEEKNQQTEREVGAVEQITQAIRVTGSTLTQIELLFTQISKNFQAINTSFGVVVTTQDETNDILKQQAAVESKQSVAGTKSLASAPVIQTPDEAVDPPGGPNLLGPFFDVLVNAAERIAQRIEKAAAKRAARKAAEEAAKKAAKKAAEAAAEKAAKKAAAEAAKKGLEGKAKQQFIKAAEDAAKKKVLQQTEKQIAEIAAKQAARATAAAAKQVAVEVIKKSAIKAVAKNLGKAVVKSIPFVGVAVGLGFAAWKLVQGDPVGAGIEAVGGLGSVVTAVPAAVASTVRDVYYEVYKVWPEDDPLVDTRMPELKQIVSDAAAAYLGKKAEPVPPATAVKTPPPAVTATVPPSAPSARQAPVEQIREVAKQKVEAAATSAEPLQKKISPAAGKQAMLDELDRQKITDSVKRAAIMAQAAVETGGFNYLSENLGYSIAGLKKTFGRLKDVSDDVLKEAMSQGVAGIGSLVYGGDPSSPSYNFGIKNLGNARPGDGFKFRGRGFFQLTGRANYEKSGAADAPQKLLELGPAAETAVSFANRFKGDYKDVSAFTRFVNGGQMHVKERGEYFEKFLNDSSITQMNVKASPSAGQDVSKQSTQVASEKTDMKRNQQPDINIIKINDTNTKKVAV